MKESVRKEVRERELPKLVGKQVYVKDKHTSGYATLSVSEDVRGYTGPVYYLHGKDGFGGKFQMNDVSWVESETIWLR
jgi:hypothetical protein